MVKRNYVLAWTWELPQTLLAMLVLVLLPHKKEEEFEIPFYTLWCADGLNAFSLGEWIFIPSSRLVDEATVRHEYGHSIQSRRLGWLYLLVVALPSVARNLYDRVAHKHKSTLFRNWWYYSGYPENEADYLGGVDRRF